MQHELSIPPDRSPLLLPINVNRRSQRRPHSTDGSNLYLTSTTSTATTEEDQLLDDIHSLGNGRQYDENDIDGEGNEARDSEEEEVDQDERELDDFSLEDGHIVGLPSSQTILESKRYQTLEFCDALLSLLRDDLQIAGWLTLPHDLPASLLHIHKVSGSLTNAVFFASIPECLLDVTTRLSTPSILATERALPSNLTALDLDLAPSTPTPSNQPLFSTATTDSTQSSSSTITISAPTVLLRIYGSASGSLISRKSELHILHTLSSDYGIGPRILGTFANGRVEQYFHSRALHKEELRDTRVSRWIGRRMRELHRVDLARMVVPDIIPSRGSSNGSRRGSLERPGIDMITNNSIYSTSPASSVFSFGTSIYSNSSCGSTSSLATVHDDVLLVASPKLLPQRGSSESIPVLKKRSRPGASRNNRRTLKETPGVWDMITRWTREAKLVLKELDDLAALPGFSQLLTPPIVPSPSTDSPFSDSTTTETPYVHSLSSPSIIFALREQFNLPLFEQQIKLFRNYVRSWEKKNGPSLRVFSHNDTQYGNLLLMMPKVGETVVMTERMLPHQQIIVVDFEYACANPRGFDIANHFIEWQADYHHPTLSHSLAAHGAFPTLSERKRFIRAYIGCDGGIDSTPSPSVYPPSSSSSSSSLSSTLSSGPSSALPSPTSSTPSFPPSPTSTSTSSSSIDNDEHHRTTEEDPRVLRLLAEAELWSPASHALWAVWGIVQSKEDLVKRIRGWRRKVGRLNVAKQRREVEKRGGAGGGEGGAKGMLRRRDSARTVVKDEGLGMTNVKNDEVDDHGEWEEAEVENNGEEEEEEEEEEEVKTDFDFLSYSVGRIELFRKELKELKIVN